MTSGSFYSVSRPWTWAKVCTSNLASAALRHLDLSDLCLIDPVFYNLLHTLSLQPQSTACKMPHGFGSNEDTVTGRHMKPTRKS